MSDYFRKTIVNIPNEKTGELQKISLEQKPVDEIITFGVPPIFIVGASGSGKTTLAMDILMKKSQQSTSIYYFTATEESMRDSTISKIPKCFRRKPTFDNIYRVWSEIKNNQDKTVSINDNILLSIINRLYTEGEEIKQTLKKKRDDIVAERLSFYSKIMDTIQSSTQAEIDGNAFFIEVAARLILDKVDYKSHPKLSQDEFQVVQSLVSRRPRVLLLFDDVSQDFDKLLHMKAKVQYEGTVMPCDKAFRALFLDMLTRGRHYALICLFIHTLDIIFDKSLLHNIIILNKVTAQKVSNAKTFPDSSRKIIMACTEAVFTATYDHYFLSVNIDDAKIFVGKAELHPVTEKIVFDELNGNFINIYNSFESGSNGNDITQQVQIDVDDIEVQSLDELI
jgi:shikimate kinase